MRQLCLAFYVGSYRTVFYLKFRDLWIFGITVCLGVA